MNNIHVLVTGGSSGIGFETCRGLAMSGHTVVFTARTEAQGDLVRNRLIRESGNKNVYTLPCRLDDFSSIRSLCTTYAERFGKLHILINNAGVWETQRRETSDGIEWNLAVNHLAGFVLTHRLLPLMEKEPGGHIINVNSQVALKRAFNFEDPEFRQSFPPMAAYRQSKRANLLVTGMLAEKLAPRGLRINCVHPGVVLTNIYRNLPKGLRFFFRFHMISPVKGAQPIIRLVHDDSGCSGLYFHRSRAVQPALAYGQRDEAERIYALTIKYVEKYINN